MQTVQTKHATMDFDRELTGILRELVQFLECLHEIKLPVTLENLRNNLLTRSKQSLTTFMIKKFGTRSSPEPYLNMTPVAPKGLMPAIEKEGELEEYVGAEEPQKQKQQHDYYESFQTVEANHAAAAATASSVAPSVSPRDKDEKIENTLIEIYANIPAAETKSKCRKCGPLYRKDGKILFLFEPYRMCWVAMIGSHLLIYGNDRDNRPHMILPLHNYMARAAPNADQRRSESTFEIFSPGSRTYQFVARTPKDMQQWVAKICELNIDGRDEITELTKVSAAVPPEIEARSSINLDPDRKEEQYQDVGCFSIDGQETEIDGYFAATNADEQLVDPSKSTHADLANFPSSTMPAALPASPVFFSGPPLPARIPRRLPSLPVSGSSNSPSYVPQNEEEDEIYHKIEDFRNKSTTDKPCYGNIGSAKNTIHDTCTNDAQGNQLSICNGVTSSKKDSSALGGRPKKNSGNKNDIGSGAGSLVPASTDDNAAHINGQDESYDDVESLLSKPVLRRPTAHKVEESMKSPQKKSFLDRMRSLKESPRKTEKKTKGKVVAPSTVDTERLSTYDDVSDLIDSQQIKRTILSEEEKRKETEENESEYNFPPPPKPIYTHPPPVADAIAIYQEGLYDDVSCCRRNYEEQDKRQLHRVVESSGKSNHVGETVRRKLDTSVPGDGIDRPKSQASFKEIEHYQTPRPNSNHREYPADQQEELYDDIAILAEFTARQKEFRNSRDGEQTTRAQASPEKRSWNRFVGGKRSKPVDSITVEETNTTQTSNGTETTDDLAQTRMNSFKKLISKMENSLGKASVKTTSTTLSNRTNATDNA
nr:uncharacterized protein LOC117223062 [Megalopta genalis]